MRRVAWTLAAGLLIAVAFLSPGCVETDTGNGVFEDYTHDADVIPDEGEGLLLGAAPGADDTEAGAGGPAFRPDAQTQPAARLFYDRTAFILGNLRQTEYVHYSKVEDGQAVVLREMDEDRGIYKYDCSGFVGDFILKQALPRHYADLQQGSARFHPEDSRPRAWGFYEYFEDLLENPPRGGSPYWKVFTSMEELQPGDIIVAKYDETWRAETISIFGKASTGHVMVAWSFAVPSTVNEGEYWILITDSSGSGHHKDTRRTTYDSVPSTTGIGKGKMWFGVNADKRPVSYRWSSVDGCNYTLRGDACDCHTRCHCEGHGCDGGDTSRSPCDDGTRDLDEDCVCAPNSQHYERLEGIILARPITWNTGDTE